MNPELLEVQHPSLITDGKIQVLAINECVIVCACFHFLFNCLFITIEVYHTVALLKVRIALVWVDVVLRAMRFCREI
jgi:hypothetical protein